MSNYGGGQEGLTSIADVKGTHRIGVNHKVSDRSPKLPAKNEKASH